MTATISVEAIIILLAVGMWIGAAGAMAWKERGNE